MQRSKRAKIYVDVWILEALSSAMTFFLAFFPCLFIKWCERENKVHLPRDYHYKVHNVPHISQVTPRM